MKVKRIIFTVLAVIIIPLMVFFSVDSFEKDRIRKSEAKANEYSGIYLTPSGTLISLYPYHGKEPFLENLEALLTFNKECPLDVFVAIPPRKMDALCDFFEEDELTKPAQSLFSLAKEKVENYIDLLPTLRGEIDLYFKTDHHWTSKGAFVAYQKIIKALGQEPFDERYFDKKAFTDSYRGSDYSKKKVDVFDSIYLYYSPRYYDFKTTLVSFPYDSEENNTVLDEMYLTDRKSSYDPYTVYFGGNAPYVTIRDGSERKTLLIIRDSFASALAPFLTEHFDVVMVDPRFYPEKLREVIERESVDLVLILENMGSFTENTVKFSY